MTDDPNDPRISLRAQQLVKLRRLIAKIARTNSFYAPRIKAAGLDGQLESLDDFTTQFPFTTKAELVADQEAHPPYGTNLTYPLDLYTRYSQTSGTTRAPMRWLDTAEGWSWMLDNWAQVYTAAEVHPGDRVFFAFSFGPFLGFWTAFESAAHMGCLCIPGGGMSSSARLQTIIDNQAQVICCTPTYALRLAQVATDDGIDLTKSAVRCIIVAGEPGGSIPATRSAIEKAWHGARVFDHHGMTEIGPVSYEAPAQPGILHVIESAYLAEVIDPDTEQHVRPGETGELVLTALGRSGSPLLRYRTGDLVKPMLGHTIDGRADLALEGGILGRVDDMITVRGVNLFPSAIDQIIRNIDDITEYRVEINQTSALTELRITIEPSEDAPHAATLCEQVSDAMRVAFNLRIKVDHVDIGQLPRFEMKAKRWVRL